MAADGLRRGRRVGRSNAVGYAAAAYGRSGSDRATGGLRCYHNRSTMETTNQSLLRRVKNRSDAASWREFFDLYQPVLVRYARMRGLSRADADDVAQECLRVLTREMPRFDYSHSRGRFKGFLWTLANNAIGQMFRKRRPRVARSAEVAGLKERPEKSRADWDRLWHREHLKYCLARVEARFTPQTVAAFKLYALQECPVAEVSRRLGLTPNQVYLAK